MRRILAVLAALLACLLLPAWAGAYKSYPYLDSVASWLSQKPVEVRCFTEREAALDINISFWGAAAYVDIDPLGRPRPFTVFAPPLCDQLRDFRAGYMGLNKQSIWAVLAIVHESGHLRGAAWPFWKSEAEVNTWAIKRAYAVAVLKFGLIDTLEAKFQFNKMVLDIYMHQPWQYRASRCQHPDLLSSGDIRCKT